LNADGVKDEGEPGLAGWTIYVDYDDDGILDEGEPYAVTDANGDYTIIGIVPGTWKVKEVAQTGWTCSFPNPCYHQETFVSGMTYADNNFGNWTTATKSGIKFHDLNADGVKDEGEPGLAGWTIYVDYDDDGILDENEPYAVTDANGDYTIIGIVPGTWKVKEVAQTGWTCSFPNPCYHQETFVSGMTYADNNFGNWTTATKSGIKFHDLNADGVKDEGEPGLAGWTIYVDYDDDGILDEGEPYAVTDANGDYTIIGIVPGTWKVKEVAQTGWTCSFPNPCYHQETFVSGMTYADNNFGNWTTATKSGIKFHDLNADGVKDEGEPGLAGWTIYVDYDDDGILDENEPYAVTDANGDYTIIGIVPGTWKVKEVAQTGWTCSFPNPCYHQETFVSGRRRQQLRQLDQTATKSGYKFTT
jgi:serine-aspartate repeat-containing protein C/D/E